MDCNTMIKRLSLDDDQAMVYEDILGYIGLDNMHDIMRSIVVKTPWTKKELCLFEMGNVEFASLSRTVIDEYKKVFEIKIFKALFGSRRDLTPTTKIWLGELVSWTGYNEGRALGLAQSVFGVDLKAKKYEEYISSLFSEK